MGEWPYLKFAALSFHTKKLCGRLHSIEVDFYSAKNEKIAFWATLSRLRGNLRTPSIAGWKARGRLYVRRWTFVAISYGWDVMSGNLSKSAFSTGWVTFGEHLRGKGASPTNRCWCQKTGLIAVSCGIKIFAVRRLVLSQYTHLTELRQQYCALHYTPHGSKRVCT